MSAKPFSPEALAKAERDIAERAAAGAPELEGASGGPHPSQRDKIQQVIVMRTDLGMRKGKMIAQGAHASMKVLLDRGCTARSSDESYGWFEADLNEAMYEWLNGLFTKICVRADSEAQLLEIYEKAKAAGFPSALIQDAGLTEFKEPTYTCCAVGPATKADLHPITGPEAPVGGRFWIGPEWSRL